jgi:protoporphyrin/coproporphyrin ferrochelatase
MKKGVVLINLGTPDDCSVSSVRKYLKEFLSDPRVIAIPAILRWLLVNCIILPTRPKKSAHAYQKIWGVEGSPLLVNSQNLAKAVQLELGDSYHVELAMRYRMPPMDAALDKLKECDKIIILPLFPQYASATTGSIIDYIFSKKRNDLIFPNMHIIRDFYSNKHFIGAQTNIIREYLKEDDYLLLSYHGLPENQLEQINCRKNIDTNCVHNNKCISGCYRSQCLLTSQLIQQELGLNDTRMMSSFQSRLGKTPWIKPYTDDVITSLREKGIENLAIACPAFVSDCLETLEEIGIQAKEQWLSLGGKRFTLIPCLNDNIQWVKGLSSIVKENTHA